MPRKPRTVMELCVARMGVHRGAVAAAKVAQWAITTNDLGRLPSTREYAEWWAVTERTGWHHRAACREALGDDWQDVVLQLARAIGERRSPRAVMGLAVA